MTDASSSKPTPDTSQPSQVETNDFNSRFVPERYDVEQYAGAVYGTIIAALSIVTLQPVDGFESAIAIVVTGAVFTTAHGYANWAGRGMVHGLGGSKWRSLGRAVMHEVPMIEGCYLPAAVLGVSSIFFARSTAGWLAMGVCVAQMAFWGVMIARRNNTSPYFGAALNIALGLTMVLLKWLVH